MAKIKETDDLDDLNFDDLGDFDDFGGFNDFEPTTAKRSVFSRLAGGFKDGVKASFTDPKNHRTVIKEALPKGYSRIYDSTEFTVESVNDLLSTARKGYGDNKDQMKKALREILPSLGGFTDQNKVGKNLKAWSEDIRQPYVHEDVDPEQAFMTTEIGDVFGNTNSSAVGNRSTPEDRARAQGKVSETAQRKLMEHASRTSQILSDRVGMQTSHDTLRHLSGMHSQLQRLTAYQDQVTNAYQRKSLEIKYRHYFVSRKSLDVLMQGLELNQAAYDKIITNTSLPEAVKIQNSEHAMMIMREKFLGDVTSPAQAKLGTIGRRIVQKAKGNIQEFFRSLGANLAGFTDSTSAMLGEDSGIDITELGGDVAGSWAGGYGMKRLAGKASRFLGRNKKLARMGAAGAGFLDNAGRVFQSALKNDTGIGWFEMLKNTGFLDEFAYRRNETIRKDATSMLDDQAMWDQKSRKALTEVIPGLLERTNFSVASILAHLTGKPAPDMERYNYSSGLFESDTAVRKRIHSDLLGERANNDTAQAIRNFVAEFETKRKLSPEAKEALMRLSLDESLNGGQMNMEAYMRGDKRFSKDEKIQKEIHAAFMENFYADHIDGVDDGDGSFIGDMNRTFRRSSSSHARLKLMNSLQGISNNMGIYDQSAVLKHMGAAGANTMLDMGIVYQDGNELKLNREKLDGTIIAQAMKMDPGYLASTLFDHLEDENTLGTSGSSNVRKMIHDLDRRFKDEVSAHDINYLRFCFDTLKQQLFAGANAELLGSTDLDTSDKRQILELAVAKLIGFTKTPQYNAMTDQGQEYFKFRIDIMKKATTVAKFYAPLKDFFTKPLEVEKDLWGKSKDAALQNLADAGLDPEIVDKLKQTIRNVKDYSGKTVDMKIAELTGTKTYGEAAAVLNRMSNNGLSWLTKAMRDPNSPPPEVDNVASLFKQTKDATEYLAKHSAFGRIVYKGFLQVESAVNNDYQNIVENQGKISQLDKLAGNANGEDFFYTSEFGFKKMNPLGASGFGVRQAGSMGYNSGSILNEDTKLESLTKNKDDKIVKSAVDRLVRVGDRIAEELKTYVENGGKLRPTRENFMGPMGDFNNPDFVGPMPADIEIHHAGGIAGRGRKWGGGGMFSSAQRYHTGGMVKGSLNITRAPNDPGLLIATLPNGQQVTIRSKTLTRLGSRASKKHVKDAFRTATREVQTKYAKFFKEANPLNGPAGGSPLLPGEVPAVLQEGEEVLRADDPRHRNNIRQHLEDQGFTSSSDDYLQGILENTTVANQLLQAIVEKEFKGGSDALGKIGDKLKRGWTSAKTRAGKIAGSIRTRVTGLFNGQGTGILGKAKSWALAKGAQLLGGVATGGSWVAGRLPGVGNWMIDKAASGWETAKEIGQKLRDKIPSMEEIKKFGGVVVDSTFVPAKEFASRRYQATKEWWAANYPKFSLDFSGFWESFKEKFKNWTPIEWAKEKGGALRSRVGMGWNTLKEGAGNLLSGPGRLKTWIGNKVRTGLGMLRGFMSGGAWAAMKYRDVEGITDEVSGLRQVYLGIVDLQSIIMDRLPKKKTLWNDKDGDGKRDASSRFMARSDADMAKVDKDGNVVPGSEKKADGLFGSIFGKSLLGFAIKALVGGIVGETMSNLFGFDLGLVGNTLAGMATVGGGLWAAKKAAGYAAGKVGQGAGAVWDKMRGKKGGGAAAATAGLFGGAGCGCCCGGDDDSGMDGFDYERDEKKRKKGRKPKRGRRAAGSGRRVRTHGTGIGRGASAASRAAAGGGRVGLASRLGGMGGRLGTVGALAGGALALSMISSDAEASEEEKTVAISEVVGGMGGSLAGAAAGAAIGSVIPIVGTAAGAIIGGMAGHWLGSTAGSSVGNSLVASQGGDAQKAALLESAKQKSQTGESLTPEEKKVLEEASKANPNILVTLIKYSPIGLAWFAAQGLMSLITGTLGIVWDGVKWVASGVGKIIGGAASLIGTAIGGVAGMIWNGAKFVVGTAAKVVGGVAGAVWDGVKWVAGTTGAILGGAAGAVWDGVKWVGKSVANGVSAAVGAVSTVVGGVAGALWNGTKAAANAAATVVTAPIKGAAWVGKKAWEGVKAAGSAVGGAISGAWNKTKEMASGAFDVLKDIGGFALAATGISALLGIGSKLWAFLNKDDNAVTRFRFIQYGLKFHRDRDAKAVLALESDHLETVTVAKGIAPSVKPKRPVEEYYAMFGVDPKNEEHVKNWLTWYHYRFKPIFLSHVSEWHKSMRNTNLHSGDSKLGAEAAKEYLKNVHYTNPERAPYLQTANPFGGDTDELIGIKDVNKAYEVALSKVKHFPSKPLTDMESESVGIKSKRQTKDDSEDAKSADKIMEQDKANGNGGLLDRLRDSASSLWDGVKKTASGVLNAGANAVSAVTGAIGDAANAVGSAVTGAWNQAKALSGNNREKYNKIRGAAHLAGDPHPDIVAAQWALESGWGKKQSGRHNYFGIKAQKGESGTVVRTREVYGGKSVMINDSFKNYNSLEEGIADRVAFIKRNPRYTKAGYYSASTPYQAAVALQRGGYATDPNYANLLCKIIKGAGYDPSAPSSKNTEMAGNKNANDGALTRGVDSVKSAASNVGQGIGAAAVGAKAQVSGAIASAASGVANAANKGAAMVSGALGNIGIGTGAPPSAVPLGGSNATPWMTLAEKQLGVNEKDHPGLIREYHKIGGKMNAGGETPWCASFVGWVLEKCGLKGSGSAAAISYAKYGTPLDKSKPIPYGAIMVIKFGKGNHVAFCASDQGSKVTMLGGNQSSKKGGNQRNGGEVTKSTIPKANVYAVVYPSGYAPGAAKTTPDNVSDAVSGVGDYAGGGGAMSGAGAKNVNGYSFKWKGEKKGNVAVDPLEHLKQLRGETTSGNTPAKSMTLSKVGTAAVKADEQNKADDARKKMLLSNEVALSQIAGFGLTGAATNASGMTGKAVTASAIAKQNEADLKAVIEAEKETATLSSREREAERLAKVNLEAKTRRVTQSSLDSQAQLVNIMQESLAEQKRMNQTLISINKGIQSLVTNSAASLRGEEKPKAATPRPVTPPETVPVSMRV